MIINLLRKSIPQNIEKELEHEFGSHFFKLIKMELKSFDPNLVSLMKKENQLTNKYRTLLAGAEIEFMGKITNLTGLSPYMQDTNRNTRKKAYQALDIFLKKISKNLMKYLMI